MKAFKNTGLVPRLIFCMEWNMYKPGIWTWYEGSYILYIYLVLDQLQWCSVCDGAKLKLDEEDKSKHAGFSSENWFYFGPAIWHSLLAEESW